jgi:hypothetical protein
VTVAVLEQPLHQGDQNEETGRVLPIADRQGPVE